MKKITPVVYIGILALTILSACSEAEDFAPGFDAESVKSALQGRWTVEKVSNKFCRDYNCSTSTLEGNSKDYFEFRADSAFIVRTSLKANSVTRDAYKAKYDAAAGIVLLTNNSRTEQFEVLELKKDKIVLESTFTGRDPAAVFTDTYYLIR